MIDVRSGSEVQYATRVSGRMKRKSKTKRAWNILLRAIGIMLTARALSNSWTRYMKFQATTEERQLDSGKHSSEIYF